MRDILAQGVVELGFDDSKLSEQIPRSMQQIKDSLKPLKSTMQETFADQLAKANVLSIKLKDSFSSISRDAKATASSMDQAAKSMRISFDMHQKLYGTIKGGFMYAKENYGGMAQAGLSGATGALGLGAGLTFAGAAAAGSTTLNTLTGSIKMLSLAAGEKTQGAILRISRLIQNLANGVESSSGGLIAGGIGAASAAGLAYKMGGGLKTVGAIGLAGAGAGLMAANGESAGGYGMMGLGLGYSLGGVPGAIAGGIAGLGYGAWREYSNMSADWDDQRQKLAIKANRLGLGEAGRRAATLKEQGLANRDANALGAGEEIEKAIAIASDPAWKHKRANFLSAGLGLNARYAGLADVRQQAQTAGFGEGALELSNTMKEMNLNLKALNSNMQNEQNKKQGVNSPS